MTRDEIHAILNNHENIFKLGELTKSLEFAHKEIEDLKKDMKEITKENNQLKQKVNYLETELNAQKAVSKDIDEKVDKVEDNTQQDKSS